MPVIRHYTALYQFFCTAWSPFTLGSRFSYGNFNTVCNDRFCRDAVVRKQCPIRIEVARDVHIVSRGEEHTLVEVVARSNFSSEFEIR